MINVAIIEDNNIIREGLAALINGTEGYKCVGVYPTSEKFLEQIPNVKMDVILMDIGLPGMNGIEAIKKARDIKPDLNFLMLTIYEESDMVFKALCAGACGYLVKKTPPSRLLEAIKDIYDGGSPMSSQIARQVINEFQKEKNLTSSDEFPLSVREKEVLNQLSNGKSYREIGDQLYISVDTVRHHIRNIYKKLHVHTQSEAVAKAIRKKII